MLVLVSQEFDDFCLMLLSADAIHIGGVFEHWIRDAMLETGKPTFVPEFLGAATSSYLFGLSPINTGEYGQPPEEIENTPTWIHLLAGTGAGRGVSFLL